MTVRDITAYLPVEGAVVRLGTVRDERGRDVTIWACPGCPTTCRTLATDSGPASAFMTAYGSHVDCTFQHGSTTCTECGGPVQSGKCTDPNCPLSRKG